MFMYKERLRKLHFEKSHDLQSLHQILVSSNQERIERHVAGMGE